MSIGNREPVVELVSVVIAAGQSVSLPHWLNDHRVLAVLMPAGWDAAALEMRVSYDGSNFYEIAETPTAGCATDLVAEGLLRAARYIVLRSGTAAAPVTQAADRVITLVVAPY